MTDTRPGFRKDVTNAEVRAHNERHLSALMGDVVPWKPPAPPEPSRKPGRQEHERPSGGDRNAPVGTDAERLSEEEWAYLDHAFQRPNRTVTQRAEELGLSASAANRIRKGLEERGLVVSFAVNLGSRTGGNVTLLDVTEAGCAELGKKRRYRRAENVSAEHWWWQRNICGFARGRGLDARTEFALNGKRADVGFMQDGQARAYEVELSPKNAIRNVKEDLRAGFARVIVACKNGNVRKAIDSRLAEALSDDERACVTLMLLSEFSFVEQLIGSNRAS